VVAFLVQLILPVYNNEGRPFDRAATSHVRRELTERFGGVTAYTRAPAEGTWADPEGHTHRDDVIIVEVMTETLDRQWWSDYSHELAIRFEQREVVVRAMSFESLSGGRERAER
jgi:hypothetical protein